MTDALADADKLAHFLEGTCATLEPAMEFLGLEDTQELRDALDGKVFECDQCGWWCEACEANANPEGGGDVCDDCADGEDDD